MWRGVLARDPYLTYSRVTEEFSCSGTEFKGIPNPRLYPSKYKLPALFCGATPGEGRPTQGVARHHTTLVKTTTTFTGSCTHGAMMIYYTFDVYNAVIVLLLVSEIFNFL